MNILLATPAPRGSTKGNRITAERWARIFRALGHRVTFSSGSKIPTGKFDLLIALHAFKTMPVVFEFRQTFPGSPVIVALTGTDLHQDLKSKPVVRKVLDVADRLVLIEPQGKKLLHPQWHSKLNIIFQSATPPQRAPQPLTRSFEVSLIGHLRAEKDPFLVIDALQKLPTASRIRVTHIGRALSPAFKKRAERETRKNKRYRWLGGLGFGETKGYLARSRLSLLTSKVEGAPNVISEAVVSNVPVVTTRIPGTIGMLGPKYPGFFSVGDSEALAELLWRCESDRSFLKQLKRAGATVKNRFSPAREQREWKKLLQQVVSR